MSEVTCGCAEGLECRDDLKDDIEQLKEELAAEQGRRGPDGWEWVDHEDGEGWFWLAIGDHPLDKDEDEMHSLYVKPVEGGAKGWIGELFHCRSGEVVGRVESKTALDAMEALDGKWIDKYFELDELYTLRGHAA